MNNFHTNLQFNLIFFIAFVLSFFLIPQTTFKGWYILLALAFMISFALVVACLFRNIKEKIQIGRSLGASPLSIIASLIGFSALQVCGPLCGVGVGIGILSAILPSTAMHFLEDYNIIIIIIAIIAHTIALYFMHCFKNHNHKKYEL